MARTDSLTNYLTDVATAIKTKKGDDTPIKASEFDTEIANLPSGGGDLSEYMDTSWTTDTSGSLSNIGHWIKLIKKLNITELPENASYFFENFKGESIDFSQYQNNITIKNLTHLFSYLTLEKLDISNLNIQATSLSGTFLYSDIKELILGDNTFSDVTDWPNTFMNSNISLSEILKFDFSNAKTMTACFSGTTNLIDVEIDLVGAGALSQLFKGSSIETLKITATGENVISARCDYLVQNCVNLRKLDLSGCSELFRKQKASSSYHSRYMVDKCASLVDLIFAENYGEGFANTVTANSNYATLDFSTCIVLSKESVLDVFNKVADISSKNTQKIILPPGMMEQLTEEEFAIPTNKGWTVS